MCSEVKIALIFLAVGVMMAVLAACGTSSYIPKDGRDRSPHKAQHYNTPLYPGVAGRALHTLEDERSGKWRPDSPYPKPSRPRGWNKDML